MPAKKKKKKTARKSPPRDRRVRPPVFPGDWVFVNVEDGGAKERIPVWVDRVENGKITGAVDCIPKRVGLHMGSAITFPASKVIKHLRISRTREEAERNKRQLISEGEWMW